MPAKSKAQQKFFAMAEHGVIPAPKGITKQQMHDFAATSTKGLPKHVKPKAKKK